MVYNTAADLVVTEIGLAVVHLEVVRAPAQDSTTGSLEPTAQRPTTVVVADHHKASSLVLLGAGTETHQSCSLNLPLLGAYVNCSTLLSASS